MTEHGTMRIVLQVDVQPQDSRNEHGRRALTRFFDREDAIYLTHWGAGGVLVTPFATLHVQSIDVADA